MFRAETSQTRADSHAVVSPELSGEMDFMPASGLGDLLSRDTPSNV